MRIVGEVSVSLGIVGGVVWASATVSVIQVIASASSTGASMGEGNGTAADAADMGDERVAVRDGNERRERSGEDHFAGTEGHAEAAKRSEEHTSELQSLMRISYAVFCLKKKKQQTRDIGINHIQHKRNKVHR